jgi:hypothetical protein
MWFLGLIVGAIIGAIGGGAGALVGAAVGLVAGLVYARKDAADSGKWKSDVEDARVSFTSGSRRSNSGRPNRPWSRTHSQSCNPLRRLSRSKPSRLRRNGRSNVATYPRQSSPFRQARPLLHRRMRASMLPQGRAWSRSRLRHERPPPPATSSRAGCLAGTHWCASASSCSFSAWRSSSSMRRSVTWCRSNCALPRWRWAAQPC